MPKIILARHVGFSADGIPLVAEYVSPVCFGVPAPPIFGLRHFRFTTAGIPVLAYAMRYCTIYDDCPKVDPSPWFPEGIQQTLRGYTYEHLNCRTARDKTFDLIYCNEFGYTGTGTGTCDWEACEDWDIPGTGTCPISCNIEGQGKWIGSITLRGGTLDLELCMIDPGDPFALPFPILPTFQLKFRGCDHGCVTAGDAAGIDCIDPLVMRFEQVSLPRCCDCHPDFTTEPAEISFRIVGNCYPITVGRHIDFTSSGIPIISVENIGGDIAQACCSPECGLVATITDNTDGTGDNCTILEGTYDLIFGDGVAGAGVWSTAISGPGILTVGCGPIYGATGTGSGTGDNELSGYAYLSVNIQCGVTASGSGSAIILCSEMENLDETIEVEITGAATTPCTGVCRYQWIEMSTTWNLIGETCTAECDDCPNAPLNPPPSPVDGEIWEEACPIVPGSEDCCRGTVLVRIMR